MSLSYLQDPNLYKSILRLFLKNPEPLNFILECLGKIDVFEEEAKSTRSRRCEEGPRSTAAVPR